MSLYDYHLSLRIAQDDPPFYALIMAVMRKADSDNTQKLQDAFPEVWLELKRRYHAALGVLPEDGDVDMVVLAEQLEGPG